MKTSALCFLMTVVIASRHVRSVHGDTYGDCTKGFSPLNCTTLDSQLQLVLRCLREKLPQTYIENAKDFAVFLNFNVDSITAEAYAVCSWIDKNLRDIPFIAKCILAYKNQLDDCEEMVQSLRLDLLKEFIAGNISKNCARQRSCQHFSKLKNCFNKTLSPCDDDMAVELYKRSEMLLLYDNCNNTVNEISNSCDNSTNDNNGTNHHPHHFNNGTDKCNCTSICNNITINADHNKCKTGSDNGGSCVVYKLFALWMFVCVVSGLGTYLFMSHKQERTVSTTEVLTLL